MSLTPATYHRPHAVLRRFRARARPCARRAAVTAAVLAGALALAPAAASPARAATLLVEGAGNGHGVGMSQDGALGLARHGWSDQAILAHYYTGTTLGEAPPKAIVRVLVGKKVLKLPLERYVRGVVAAEMPSSWPAAALQAQAIASRTYALTSHAGGSRFDVYSDTRSQVYQGAAAETASSNAAVAATAGQVVLYHGNPATTYFFASSGGMTESIENGFVGSAPAPWLLGVSDPYDKGPTSQWSAAFTFGTAAKRLHGLVNGSFRGIEVLRRGVSPRIVSALVLGSHGSTLLTGPQLAARLGLFSTWAYFSVRRGKVVHAEPDRSGGPSHKPRTRKPSASNSPPAGPQGGAQAPGGSIGSPTGGVVAK